MEEREKKPKIRFAGFSGEWEEKKLEEIVTAKARIGWQGLTKNEHLENGEYYLITGTDFKNGLVDFNSCSYVNADRYLQDTNIQIRNDDVLITKDGTLGKVAYVENLNKPATLNSGIFVVRGKSININHLYLYHYLNAPYLLEYANQESTGGTIKHLNQNVLVNFPIPITDVIEQQKIGALFSNIDNLITQQQKKYDKLVNIKKSMLEKMFPQNDSKYPEVRFEGFSDEWEIENVEELCSISTGKSNTQDKIQNGIYPFYVRSPIIEQSNRYLYDEEAVLTVGDGVGTGKVFHYVNGKYDLHQRVYRMYDFNNKILGKYFFYYFSDNFYDRVMMMTAKTSVDSVRHDMIAKMSVEFPSIEEQIKIVKVLDNLSGLMLFEQKQLEKLKTIKKSLLENMFV